MIYSGQLSKILKIDLLIEEAIKVEIYMTFEQNYFDIWSGEILY